MYIFFFSIFFLFYGRYGFGIYGFKGLTQRVTFDKNGLRSLVQELWPIIQFKQLWKLLENLDLGYFWVKESFDFDEMKVFLFKVDICKMTSTFIFESIDVDYQVRLSQVGMYKSLSVHVKCCNIISFSYLIISF